MYCGRERKGETKYKSMHALYELSFTNYFCPNHSFRVIKNNN